MSLVWEIHRFTAVRICTTDDCKWTNSVINCFYIFKKAVYAGNNMISPPLCLFYWESFVANVVYILSIQVFCINMVGAQILWMKSGKSGTLTLSANIVFHFQQRRMEPAVHIYYADTFPFLIETLVWRWLLYAVPLLAHIPVSWLVSDIIRFSQSHNSWSGSLLQ